ncbi:MAG TPA: M56 family metallopeptidase, partial [Gammaproteobacteria bacterium]|nr:M56 family metallopeptidase [Gammaproteobacteria bacterium]
PAVSEASWSDALRELLRPMVPWTVPVWCAGVALMALRSFAAWHRIHRLTREGAEDAPDQWQDRLVQLAMRVGVRVRVRLMVTAKVAVPCVVGWMKPVILIPPAALIGLSALQLEMVLAHELSHIRRHDYLVNLLQLLVETMLFYHPVVRWISQDARRERELCCDDSAVHACGDALHYAHTLTDLADIQAADMHLAVGLNGGDLALRVERLIAPHHVSEGAPRLPTLMLAATVFVGGLMMLASARHLPLPFTQLRGLQLYSRFIPRNVQTQQDTRIVLAPTRVQEVARRASGPEAVAASQLVTDMELMPMDASYVPLPVRDNPPAVVQVHAVTIPMDAATQSQPMDKQTMEPVRIIPVNPRNNAPVQGPHHEYCTPLTGSRVCR